MSPCALLIHIYVGLSKEILWSICVFVFLPALYIELQELNMHCSLFSCSVYVCLIYNARFIKFALCFGIVKWMRFCFIGLRLMMLSLISFIWSIPSYFVIVLCTRVLNYFALWCLNLIHLLYVSIGQKNLITVNKLFSGTGDDLFVLWLGRKYSNCIYSWWENCWFNEWGLTDELGHLQECAVLLYLNFEYQVYFPFNFWTIKFCSIAVCQYLMDKFVSIYKSSKSFFVMLSTPF